MRKMRILREYLIERLIDKERAIGYLQAILDDYYIFGGAAVVRDALDTVVEAQGGVSKVAKQSVFNSCCPDSKDFVEFRPG